MQRRLPEAADCYCCGCQCHIFQELLPKMHSPYSGIKITQIDEFVCSWYGRDSPLQVHIEFLLDRIRVCRGRSVGSYHCGKTLLLKRQPD